MGQRARSVSKLLSILFTPDTEFKGMALVEVNRGCPRGCRFFCGACFAYHPFRYREPSRAGIGFRRRPSKRTSNRTHRNRGFRTTRTYSTSVPDNDLNEQGGVSLEFLKSGCGRSSLIRCLKEDRRDGPWPLHRRRVQERLRRILRKGYRKKKYWKPSGHWLRTAYFQIKCRIHDWSSLS